MFRWLFSGEKRESSREPWELSSPLLHFAPREAWTVGHAVEGTLVTGATGSGKSSGSGREIARAFLRQGFGGLVLTVKPDERATWERYCAEAGRSDDLIVFGPETPYQFNFLDHERTRKGAGAGHTENIVNLLSTVLEIGERNSGSSGRDSEGYWRDEKRRLARNCVELLSLAGDRVAVPDLYQVVISAPTSNEQKGSDEWRKRSACFRRLAAADQRAKTPRQQADFALVADYFLVEWPQLAEKTRSIIASSLTSAIDILNRGELRELFCGGTNLTPEATEQGKVIVVDLPVKEFGELGLYAQVLWKYAWERSIERRNIQDSPRPVFLWADEAQHFVTSYDMLFQTTCRSARVATVLLTQNLSNFYAALGGNEKGRAEANSLFANLNTKILHAQGDSVTNEWAAALIGRTRQFFANANTSHSAEDRAAAMFGMDWLGHTGTTSAGFSESYEYEVQPSAFTQLRTGGPANGWNVDAIVFQNGRVFRESGKTWLPVTFRQRG